MDAVADLLMKGHKAKEIARMIVTIYCTGATLTFWLKTMMK